MANVTNVTKIAEFSISHTQYLNEHSELTQELPDFAQDTELLLTLYRQMVLTRMFDIKAVKLQRTGQLGTYPASLGQEAIAVALGFLMEKQDVFCPAYREQGTQLLRGVSIANIYRYWGGYESGNDYGPDNQDFPPAIPIATQYLHATGIAMAMQLRAQKRVTVVCGGDGSTSKGDFYEALNLAGVRQLPIVFVINNNQWAISLPFSKQTHAQTIAQKAIAAGFEGQQVDGNDLIASYEVISSALEKARKGGGPQLIEAMTYRLGDHTTADDAMRYRSDEELKQAWQREPIRRLKNYLINTGHWSEEQELALQKESRKTIDQEVLDYLNTPDPKPEDMFDYLYAELPEQLEEQRQIAIAEGEQDA